MEKRFTLSMHAALLNMTIPLYNSCSDALESLHQPPNAEDIGLAVRILRQLLEYDKGLVCRAAILDFIPDERFVAVTRGCEKWGIFINAMLRTRAAVAALA